MTNIQKITRRYMLQHAHPTKFVAEILGIMWSVYLLWNHRWVWALCVAVVSFLLSTLLLWGNRFEYLSSTTLGKVILVYSHPLNFVLYNLSALPLIYGLWVHETFYILVGVTIILLPHLWAWRRSGSK